MTEALSAEAAADWRRERADELLRAYTAALIHAQATHDALDWIAAGSAFKRYAVAAVAEDWGEETALAITKMDERSSKQPVERDASAAVGEGEV